MVVDRQPAVMDDLVIPVRELLGVVLLAAVTWWLARRLRTATPLQRRANAPVVVMSLAWLATLVAYLVTRRAAPDSAAVDTVGAHLEPVHPRHRGRLPRRDRATARRARRAARTTSG